MKFSLDGKNFTYETARTGSYKKALAKGIKGLAAKVGDPIFVEGLFDQSVVRLVVTDAMRKG